MRGPQFEEKESQMSKGPDRRMFTRVSARLEADLETEEGLEIRGVLVNLSVRGFFLRTQEFAPPNSHCRIQLYPLGRGFGALNATGTIAREGVEGLGIEFDNLPYETFEAVRTIILGASERPERVEDELLDRLGVPPGE